MPPLSAETERSHLLDELALVYLGAALDDVLRDLEERANDDDDKRDERKRSDEAAVQLADLNEAENHG